MPITSTNQPNAGFNLAPSMRFEIRLPITIPNMAKLETINNKLQLIIVSSPSPAKPINDFAAMITKEVPTASFIGSFDNSTNAGMIKKPPPAPTKPVNTPTTIPSNNIIG